MGIFTDVQWRVIRAIQKCVCQLTQQAAIGVVTQDSDTVVFTGAGTETDPLTAEATGGTTPTWDATLAQGSTSNRVVTIQGTAGTSFLNNPRLDVNGGYVTVRTVAGVESGRLDGIGGSLLIRSTTGITLQAPVVDNQAVKKGIATFTPDNTATVLTIPHGLVNPITGAAVTPSWFEAINLKGYAGNYAGGAVTANATNIIVTFTTAPLVSEGAANFAWKAEI